MPPRLRSDYPPLNVEAATAAVHAGRAMRVGILPTHQFPDGAAGRIKQVGDPAVEGPEFIQVEVTVGGSKDVIPFAPADLSPIKRSQAAPEPSAPPVKATIRRPRLKRPPVVESPTPPMTFPGSTQPEPATSRGSEPSASRPSASTGKPSPTGSEQGQEPVVATGGEAPLVRKPVRGKRQPIVVTLSTTEPDHTGWQLEVKVGTRLVVKPTPVHPARAWALVTDLGNPEVARVVAGALNEHRQQAQEKADRLARELAEAQAELADYPIF